MSGRDLKHFETSMDKLKLFASSMGIAIKYEEKEDTGMYVPTRRRIVLGSGMSESDELSTLLHELGHVVDDTVYLGKDWKFLNDSYRAIYTEKYTKAQQNAVIQCEKRAWKYGRRIAQQLKIRLGKWYDACEKECLAAYKR